VTTFTASLKSVRVVVAAAAAARLRQAQASPIRISCDAALSKITRPVVVMRDATASDTASFLVCVSTDGLQSFAYHFSQSPWFRICTNCGDKLSKKLSLKRPFWTGSFVVIAFQTLI